ncbi:hypothetical protein TNCV_2418211 [Trichonephila clavipes]|nr:hypothetical protein TNCV_2418211 [Trichonephila clavipes]
MHLHRQAIIKNVDKITEIIEIDRHITGRSIAQEQNIDHKTVLSHLRKICAPNESEIVRAICLQIPETFARGKVIGKFQEKCRLTHVDQNEKKVLYHELGKLPNTGIASKMGGHNRIRKVTRCDN